MQTLNFPVANGGWSELMRVLESLRDAGLNATATFTGHGRDHEGDSQTFTNDDVDTWFDLSEDAWGVMTVSFETPTLDADRAALLGLP